jgi:uncharacterized iron-regulated membrane protein
MTMGGILLKIHLWLGLAAALFLVILGLTGSVIAFEDDIVHWTHPGLFYVKTGAHTLPEQELIRAAEQRFAPAQVGSVQVFRQANLVRVMQMTGNRSVFVNPYDGSIVGSVEGGFAIGTVLGYIHQVHLRLVPNPRSAPGLAAVGKVVVSYAGLILCLMVPTGLILFWRTRRTSVKWSASWSRVCFDLHHVIGIYAALFLLIAAFTGILIGFESGEKAIYSVTGSQRPAFTRPPQSKPAPGATPLTADQAIEIAHRAIANASVAGIAVPGSPKASWTILLRVPEDTSETVHSSVTVDSYSGGVLQVRNFLTDSTGYRVIRFNRSIHTGDVWGLPTHILMSVSSLALVAMAVTGIVIWAKKLAL